MSFNKRMLSAGAAKFVPSEHFKVITYTGTGSSHAITGVGFKPDLVWIKNRGASQSNSLTDSSRGDNLVLQSNETSAEASGQITLDSDGFTIGNDNALRNASGNTYVAWCWKAGGGTTSSNTDGTITTTVQANTKAGFSIFTYTGTGNNATIGHGLESDPKFVTIKTRSHTSDWPCYHGNLGGGEYRIKLNSADARDTTNNPWNNTDPNSTVITIKGSAGNVNQFPRTFVGYAWHDVEGFSKIGTYNGNGSANGPVINTGFEVAMVLIKNRNNANDWQIFDNARNTSNPRTEAISPSSTGGDWTDSGYKVDFLSNGFKIKGDGGGINDNNEEIVYMAFAADPDEEAPAVASSFGIRTYTGNNTTNAITGLGFKPNFIWFKDRGGTYSHALYNSVRGRGTFLRTNTDELKTGASATQDLASFDSDGFTLGSDYHTVNNANARNYVAWAWKADDNEPTINDNGSNIDSITSVNAAAGFSIVQWTGTGNAAHTVGHGLSATPEWFMMKDMTEAGGWNCTHVSLASDEGIGLNSNAGAYTSMGNNGGVIKSNLGATTFGFTAGAQTVNSVNKSGNEYIAYCFHSVTGFSKFGSYTGNGSTQSITGVGFKPDFIMFKKTNASQDWLMVDSIRGGQKELVPNNTSAEYTMSNGVSSFDNDGWSMGANNSLNTNSATYIYMAFKINSIQIDYLVIAGGGGGGTGRAGGGGAGGYIYKSGGFFSAATVYTITVGAGGAAETNGSDSVFGSITATGGGRGGSISGNGTGAAIGGSGGGGKGLGTTTEAGAAGTSGQGNAGGHGYYTGGTQRSGGGGGGSSAAGANASANTSGAGGNGTASSITGSSVTRAGGGGGGSQLSGEADGGTGGGGDGGRDTAINATAGTANTGSGGGGGGGTGGAGGSGIVILRLLTSDYTGTTSGSPTVTTDGDYTVLQYTSSGTYTA